jgi:hypothetical protein
VRCLLALLCPILAAVSAAAQPFDPLKSEACGEALQRLEQARGAERNGVEALRSQAAQTCLGSSGPPARPSRLARPPVAVPPPLIEPPPQASSGLPDAPRLPPAPVVIERAPVITSCDAHGCWTADGARLPRAGAGLAGPCTALGGLAYCP